MPLIKKNSVTDMVDGVEYNSYPPPDSIIKVMKRCWAEKFLSTGSIRFGSLAYYRKWENDVLGDPNEGKGMFRMNGHPYEIGSSFPVYAWCSALPAITPKRIKTLAEHGTYDCLLRIQQPATLIKRIRTAILNKRRNLLLHCSEVTYNRGAEVDKVTLNSQKFHFNVFQKDQLFAEDQEYRISLRDPNLRPESINHIDLHIGVCSDIAIIENLPKIGVQKTAKKTCRP